MTGAAAGTRPPIWWTLIRHEIRLTFRDFGSGSARRRVGRDGRQRRLRPPRSRAWSIFGGVLGFILLHAVGAVSLVLPYRWIDTQAARIAATAFLVFLFTLMLSTAMSRVVSAFHERRDLDLLLSAPIAPALVLAIRALTIVAAVAVLFALFVFPLADVGVASGRWWMARLYLVVPSMAAFATGVALILTGALVRLIGVRRARVGLQVFSALVGASFYLVSQARQLLPDGLSSTVIAWAADRSRDPPAAFVAASRLAGGDLPTWFAFLVGSIGLFAASVWLVRNRFLDVARRPEAEARVSVAARGVVERRFAGGFTHGAFGTLLRKEWRLILRAPQLLSQVLLQLLYLTPLMLSAFGRHGAGAGWTAAAFAAGIVGITGTLATSLAWLTVSAEDAPDLLAGSPRGPAVVLWAKLCAATAPPIAILGCAAIGLARRSPVEAAVVLAYGALSCVSAAILEAASPTPGKRSDFQRRHKGRGAWVLVEGLQFVLWGAAAGAAVSGHGIVAATATLLALGLPAFRLPRALTALRPAGE